MIALEAALEEVAAAAALALDRSGAEEEVDGLNWQSWKIPEVA